MNSKISNNTRTSRINWKKMLSAAMLSAFTLAPIVAGSTPAMADRDDRDRDDRDRDDRDRDDRGRDYRDRDNDSRNNSYRENRTYEGTVTNDQSGREFVLRLDSGQRVQVRSEEREPRRLSSGDRVRVQGYFLRTGERDQKNTRYNDNVIFRATDVQITRNNKNRNGNNGNRYGYGNNGGIWGGYGNNDSRRSIFGVVTAVNSDRRITVRADGRDYDVESARRLGNEISRGDRVQVSGEMRDNNITRASVVRSNGYNDRYGNNGNSGNYRNNSNFEFSGRVTDMNESARTMRVRGDNGQDYSLRAEDYGVLKGVRRSDRVRVRGQMRNGTFIVDDVDKI